MVGDPGASGRRTGVGTQPGERVLENGPVSATVGSSMSIVTNRGRSAIAIGYRTQVPWQQELREAVRDPAELAELLELPAGWLASARRAAGNFGLFAPRGLLARVCPGNVNDPILKQIAPLDAEWSPVEGFVADPVGDLAAQAAAGMLHKYHGRALLVVTGACAVHCRYCFRRHFPYGDAPHGLTAWKPALESIATDPTLEEIILSGGDPLTLGDGWLAGLAHQIAAIPHVRRLRVHTRLPIVIPQRVTDELLAWLTGTRLTPIVVIHANHASEIDEHVAAALGRLVDSGVPVLNQAVLLRGVNDSCEALEALCRRLIDLRVMPYYLHQLDRVAGAAHFEVPLERGREIVAELRRRLPGYAVPQFVTETSGAAHKTPLA